jgi:hypothetical protein
MNPQETSLRLPELKTSKGIQSVIRYLKSGELPKRASKTKYEERYGKESGFHIRNNKLYKGKQEVVPLLDLNDVNLHKSNHYPEFKTAKGIKKVIDFIKTGNQSTPVLEQRFGKDSGFHVKDGKLYQGSLEVVYPKDREKAILSIYEDDTKGLGVGLQQFYQSVASKYLNIFKKDTDKFLQKQGDYKIAVIPRRHNMSIVAKRPAERWGIDLIDMTMYPAGVNHQKKYIMTVVDYFSGKVWARGIPNRENGLEIPVQQANDDLREFPNEIIEVEHQIEPAIEVEPEKVQEYAELTPLATKTTKKKKKRSPESPFDFFVPTNRTTDYNNIQGGGNKKNKGATTKQSKAKKTKKILTTKFLNQGLNPEEEFKRLAEQKKLAPEIQKQQREARQAKKKENLGETVR